MTATKGKTIGFDRPLQIEWLDAVAGRLAAGASAADARAFAWRLLEGVVAGATVHSARGKTLTVLSRVWLTVPKDVRPFRDDAVRAIGHASSSDRLAIHWALISAAYPFFVDIAANAGKLIALHGEFALGQLTRRLIDVWGDRSTLRPAAQRVIRSMVRWGALRDVEKRGHYLPTKKRLAVSAGVGVLLLEGLLVSSGRGLPLRQLFAHPAAFPFDIRVEPALLRKSARFRCHRQGDETDIVERDVGTK